MLFFQAVLDEPRKIFLDPDIICIDSDDSIPEKTETKKKKTVKKRNKKSNKKRIEIKPMASFKSKKRKALENQPKITGFLKDPSGYNNYFKSHKESLMPSIITGDMDMENVLEICLLEKENQSIDSTENSIAEKNKPSSDVLKMKNLDELIVYHDTIQSSLYSPEKDKWNLEQDDVPIVSQSDTGSSKTALSASTSNVKSRSRAKVCPSYKIIAGTTFCVDGFRFGMIAGVSHYFLTHFHSDHYIGLRKSFNMPLYLSEITCNIIKL